MPRKTRAARSTGFNGSRCFNEAAARCRGKLVTMLAARAELVDASMRPRPDAAENLHLEDIPRCSHTVGFNEAAARCRGKLV